MTGMRANFDRVARAYRWMEYLSFGSLLERCRFHFMGELRGRRRALVLGDGDGRFTARLMAVDQEMVVEAVDSSAEMLCLLSRRVEDLGPDAKLRLRTRHADALDFVPDGVSYDLVATHFFLDCLDEVGMEGLIRRVTAHLTPGAVWVVSEFAYLDGRAAAFGSRVLIGLLYRAFGALTGLRVRSLPNYGLLLRKAGFALMSRQNYLGGLLVSELWQCDAQGEGNQIEALATPRD